jgi:hypothetical protein
MVRSPPALRTLDGDRVGLELVPPRPHPPGPQDDLVQVICSWSAPEGEQDLAPGNRPVGPQGDQVALGGTGSGLANELEGRDRARRQPGPIRVLHHDGAGREADDAEGQLGKLLAAGVDDLDQLRPARGLVEVELQRVVVDEGQPLSGLGGRQRAGR